MNVANPYMYQEYLRQGGTTQAYNPYAGQYNPRAQRSVGADAATGAAAGAAVGSLAGPWGAAIGGVVGGIGGAGYALGTRGKTDRKNNAARLEAGRRAAEQGMIAMQPTGYLNTLDPTSQTYQAARMRIGRGYESAMSPQELFAAYQQEQEAKQRAGYEQAINAYFADPSRAQWQQQIVQDRMANDLANVSEQYGRDLQQSVQSNAARGMLGGSTDVEGRGDAARVRDTRALGVAADAENVRANFAARDQQERANLMGLVNQRGITDGQQLAQALQGINTQTAAEGAQYASGQRQNEINRFGQQAQSQAWGQGLSSIANSWNRQNQYNANSRGGW